MGAGDGNDLVYTQYGIDLQGILSSLLGFVTGDSMAGDTVYAFLLSFWWFVFVPLSYLASIILLYGIIYTKFRLHELEHIHEHNLAHAEEHYAHAHAHAQSSKNQRWDTIVRHSESDNPNDWRLAIIEADIILEEALNGLGYAGLTIGDKLKQASPQFFIHLEDAWKAHKVRNDIAHRGSDFVLTKRVAKETIELYRRVFEELQVI